MHRLSVALLILATLAACVPDPSLTSNPGLDAIAAQSTIAVAGELQRQAAEAARQSDMATGAAIQAQAVATQHAEQQATAVAIATSAQVTADVHALSMAATSQSLTLDATATSYAMASTQQAVQAVATMEAAAVADAARKLALERQAEQAAIERGRLWNTVIWPAVTLILALAVAGLIAILAYRLYQRSRPSEVRQVGDRILVLAGNNVPYQIAAPRIVAPAPLALPAGEPVARPANLPALPEGHVLVIGPSQSGKSTTVKVIAAKRPGKVIALDPHSSGGNDWGHAEVIGTSRNFSAIEEYLCFMSEELNRRYRERGEYGRANFESLTVAVDETPAIVKALGSRFTDVWATWVREGWKVGLFVAMSSQSDRVRTLGIEGEGDVRENFAFVLYLRDEAIKRFGGMVAGMERPIVLRTPQGARPIIISQEDLALIQRPANRQSNGSHQPFILPAPIFEQRPQFADPNNLDARTRERIKALSREGLSKRQIQIEVFGYDGGRAFYAVSEVLDGNTTGGGPYTSSGYTG